MLRDFHDTDRLRGSVEEITGVDFPGWTHRRVQKWARSRPARPMSERRYGMAEIGVLVGSLLTVAPDEDPERYEREREYIVDLLDILRADRIELDLMRRPGEVAWETEIETVQEYEELRRRAAYLERLRATGADPGNAHRLLKIIWDGRHATTFPHLVVHQGPGGFYLPADFPEPIWVGTGGSDPVSFGSSFSLLRELDAVEALFEEAGGVPPALDVLRRAARRSVDEGLPVILL